MVKRILILGSSGLVGAALQRQLSTKGTEVVCFDIRADGAARGNILDRAQLARAMHGIDGVIHLAAVSRVLWGEQNPELCWTTNVEGIHNTLELSSESASSPWVIFASSREVYGQPDRLPASEDCPLRPVNIYGRSKLAGERLVSDAQRDGIRACTVRLSNVFGSILDHSDRVVPAFTRAAALGHQLRIDGDDHMFDFTHVDDVARGIVALTELLASECRAPPPIHFVSGVSTTLGELAQLSIRIAHSGASIRQAAPRDFDVARFVGDPTRARSLLHWRPQVDLAVGLAAMIQAFRDSACNTKTRETA